MREVVTRWDPVISGRWALESAGRKRALGRRSVHRLPALRQIPRHPGHGRVLHLLPGEDGAVRRGRGSADSRQPRPPCSSPDRRQGHQTCPWVRQAFPAPPGSPGQRSAAGRRKRLGWASSRPTGIRGPWWEPRIQPSTMKGMENGSSTSPTAGKAPCALTTMVGSSLPTYRPAISESLSVLETAPTSPVERLKPAWWRIDWANRGRSGDRRSPPGHPA